MLPTRPRTRNRNPDKLSTQVFQNCIKVAHVIINRHKNVFNEHTHTDINEQISSFTFIQFTDMSRCRDK